MSVKHDSRERYPYFHPLKLSVDINYNVAYNIYVRLRDTLKETLWTRHKEA